MNYHASRLSPRAKRRRWPARERETHCMWLGANGKEQWKYVCRCQILRTWKRHAYHIAVPEALDGAPEQAVATIACGVRGWWCTDREPRRNPHIQCPACLKAWREQTKVTP